MLNTQNPVQSGTYCCTLPIAIYLTDYYVTCIQRQRIFFKTPCDSAGARTQDPNIKSVVLYLLSYEVILSKNYLFVLTSAKLQIIFQTTKCFTNFFFVGLAGPYLKELFCVILTSAKLRIIFQTCKCFDNFFKKKLVASSSTNLYLRL